MSKNHNAKNCTQRLICRTCKENHPAGVHEYYISKCEAGKYGNLTESKESIRCAPVNGKLEAEVTSICVVPIWVGHKNSVKMFKTYAMLENCSQGSFIKNKWIEDLLITGRKLQLSLKTLAGEKSDDTMTIDGLIVSGIQPPEFTTSLSIYCHGTAINKNHNSKILPTLFFMLIKTIKCKGKTKSQ